MARERIFSRETRLYHHIDGWKAFPAGETDPGPAWSEHEGPAAEPGSRDGATLKEMADLTVRAEKAEALVSARAHDMARLEQAAADSAREAAMQKARADEVTRSLEEAQANVLRIAAERDQANGNESQLRAEVVRLKGLIQEYETDLANAKAKIAAFDGDGNGEPGGSKPRKARAAEEAGAL
jgi:hypothetical protein